MVSSQALPQVTASGNNMLKLRLVQCLITLFESSGCDPTPSFIETMLAVIQAVSVNQNDHEAGVTVLKAITAGCCVLHRATPYNAATQAHAPTRPARPTTIVPPSRMVSIVYRLETSLRPS